MRSPRIRLGGGSDYTIDKTQQAAVDLGKWSTIKHRFGGITSHILVRREADIYTACAHTYGLDQHKPGRQAEKTCSTCEMIEKRLEEVALEEA